MADFTSDEKEKLPSYLLDKSAINRGFGREMAICNTVLRMMSQAIDPVIRLAEKSMQERTDEKVMLTNPLMHLVEWTENNQMVLYDSSRNAFRESMKQENRFDREEEFKKEGK